MGWTRSKSWNTGRKQQVETFSGAALPAPWGANANSTGAVTTDIDADRTLVTDQAGKQRISKTNALGQLKEVWEILAASEAGSESVSFPNTSIAHGFKSSYSYDTLNNLTTVNQGVQTRNFSYSSLSRLLSANNPESGAISYLYDNNGNLTRKTDARGVQTDYVYDALNRVTNRNYSTPNGTPGTGVLANYAATPNVSYFYDNLPNAKGKLTKVSSSVSTTEYTAFDILGRVTTHKQTTDGQNYTTAYVYNLSGALTEETYPSGRVVKNVLETDGDLMQVLSKRANDNFRNYANAFTYNAAGAVTQMRLGNGKWETTQFNSRLQPIQIGLGASAASTNLLRLNYDYGATQNNGNVLSQTITVPTVGSNPGFTAVQNYTYDSLNRLKDADEKPLNWNETNCTSDPTKCWKQTFVYDRYGNRTFDTTANRTTTIPVNCPTVVCNPSPDPANNKLIGYQFDNSGNTKQDAENRTFIYDSENKQVEAKNASNQTVGQYFYDGDGKRIKKYVPSTGETTIFVYDPAGKLVAEYSTIVAPANEAKIAYLTNDHLGSPRTNTDATGNVTARHDYRPFGEEIATNQRTVGLGYATDTVRKQFIGYERDKETDLDFAQARYHNFTLGRFSSPDDFLNDSDVTDPQSWNKYVYCRNNPLKLTDKSGKTADVTVTIDEKTKTGVIQISATIGIWTKNSKISSKDMQKAADAIKKNIEGTWKGTFEKDGITYTVQTKIDVSVRSGEMEGRMKGDQNLIELDKGLVDGRSDARSGNHEFFTGRDNGRWNIDAIGSNLNLPAHEFGHLLGVYDKSGSVLMNTKPAERHSMLTAEDFDWAFGSAVVGQRRDSRYETVIEDRERGYRKIRRDSGSERNSSRTYRMSAPSLGWWWRSQ